MVDAAAEAAAAAVAVEVDVLLVLAVPASAERVSLTDSINTDLVVDCRAPRLGRFLFD